MTESLCYGSSSVETTGNKIQVYDSFISKHVRIIYKEPRIVAGFELLASRDPPASAPLSVGITGMSHCPWPKKVLQSEGKQKESGSTQGMKSTGKVKTPKLNILTTLGREDGRKRAECAPRSGKMPDL
ncbi:lysophosphatidic acid receptor 6 isoform X3 [Homo sapiens]|uniref:lysophosphatidic acid receptor 6 isoform X3 n=1 Tax=Homo sapiens TaxID=9606 RepID=UPI001FB101EC|nr:lysophosphatidic acid receptor 6 isoform X3 [Homo sapiens]XP_054229963.1 lysophosphatidic acid receptor 6 isoform X3 [Homo sapiens]